MSAIAMRNARRSKFTGEIVPTITVRLAYSQNIEQAPSRFGGGYAAWVERAEAWADTWAPKGHRCAACDRGLPCVESVGVPAPRYAVESGHVKDGAEVIVTRTEHEGIPRRGAYEKVTPIKNGPFPSEYAKLNISALVERVVIL
jgi:hypothetical protein